MLLYPASTLLLAAFSTAHPALPGRSLSAAQVDELRAQGMTERAILLALHATHPTPSLPFRSSDGEDRVWPHSGLSLPPPTMYAIDAATADQSGVRRVLEALLRGLGFGRGDDAYEGMQELAERPPRWQFRWGPNGERLLPEKDGEGM